MAKRGRPRRKEELSSRERVRLALEHRQTDRIPIAMVCSGINEPARRDFAEYLERERGVGLDDFLDSCLDIADVRPQYIGPRRRPGEDLWGVVRRPANFGLGAYDEIDHYPLAAARDPGDLDRHRWPSPDWFDYAVLPERVAQAQARRERCLMVANGNIFETAWYMRGFERMLEDLALRPELARAILGRVADFQVEHFARMLAAARGGVDLAFTADDLAGQQGPLMSASMWEEFVKPHHVRLNQTIHEFGVRVIYHSDGAVMDLVGGLADMGIDVLQALQFSAAGMDPRLLKAQHGGRLSFEGGVSVQTTLPFGTPAQVESEVEELIAVLGKGGGYILGPSHAIQAGTLPANILAMFETALGFYPHG